MLSWEPAGICLLEIFGVGAVKGQEKNPIIGLKGKGSHIRFREKGKQLSGQYI